MRRNTIIFTTIAAAGVLLLLLNLALGSVSIPFDAIWGIITGDYQGDIVWQNIVIKSRLPTVITAICAGAGLSISGLQMQTLFRNPLAGPSELGISAGASLGVALVILLSGSILNEALIKQGLFGEVALTVAAICGALVVMVIILSISRYAKGSVTLLIVGVMIGYIATALIGVLKFFSSDEDVKGYVIWGLGSFSKVSGGNIQPFVICSLILIALSFLLIKRLNLMLLGDNYARSLGQDVRSTRLWTIISSCSITAVITAYCGPIIFLGLAVPHLCRMIFVTSDHRLLMPAVTLVGAVLAMLCNLIARMPGIEGALPINSVTALIGAPIVLSVIFERRSSIS
ncbi:MAG: iron ABC transporter permease [Rikenellaceae bacterium]